MADYGAHEYKGERVISVPFLPPSFPFPYIIYIATMLPTSCLIAVLVALASSALTIPRPPHTVDVQIPAILRLSDTDQTSLTASAFEITDALPASVLAEMDDHMADYASWDLSEKRLISIEGPEGEEYKWVTEMDKVVLRANGKKFMDM